MQEAEELYDLRECLEAFAVEKATAERNSPGLERLQHRIDLYGQDIRKRFTRERLLYDQDIHLEIAELAGNKTLRNALAQVFERIVLKRKIDALYDEARGLDAHQEHLGILAAMRKGDVQEAVQRLRFHIQKGKENVLSDLKQREAIRGFPAMERKLYK
jgi:DNA-binding GntR family transcriptional regulator